MDVTVRVWRDRWTPDDCGEHRTWLFVYGDNTWRRGMRGQAVVRLYPNTVGIVTKHAPSKDDWAYFSDDAYESNCSIIDKDVTAMLTKYVVGRYECLVLPADGWGTGLAELPTRAPRTYAYLETIYNRLVALAID